MRIEFLWFDGCPSYELARELLESVLRERDLDVDVEFVNASQSEVAEERRFPGSPTIRIDGKDVEPGFIDPGSYTPRCRLYLTALGLKGTPERRWIEEALDEANTR